jgi:hypothetical protein
MSGYMLIDSPPMSNAERQRKFQLGHPGYDARRKARQRQSARRAGELLKAKLLAEAEARRAAMTAGDVSGQLLLFPTMRPAA